MTTLLAEPDALTAGDIDQLAAMHCQILPDSLVSRIGVAYARSFYRYVARSEAEHVFLHRDEDRVASACVISLEPNTLQKRLVLGTPLAWRAALAVRRLPLLGIARALRRDRSGGEPVQPRGPEVLLIFTVAEARSTGLGAETIARTEQYLRSRGHQRYFVKTLDDPGNRAIAFYQRRGFDRLGAVIKNGKPLAVFAKGLGV